MSPTAPQTHTIPAVAKSIAERRPHIIALVENGKAWTFAQLYRDARAAASAFLAHGIGKGDIVGIWAPNRREWILAALGAQCVGAAITPLNTRLKGREAGDLLRRSRAQILFTTGAFLGTDYPALLAHESLPALRSTVLLDGTGNDGWAAFVGQGRGAEDPAVDVAMAAVGPEDLSDILFTSGTTGAPKGALSTHGQVVLLFRSWVETTGLREGDRYLIANPFFHTFGYKAGWLAALIAGATILPMPVFDAAAMALLIEQERITFIPGPPTIYQMLLAQLGDEPRDFSSLRVAVTGAATVPPILIERMQKELGFQIVITAYGMTECGVITMCRAGDPITRIAETCGRAIPGLQVHCVDDAGQTVAPGATGEILVRGYGVMSGYLDDAQATSEAIDADGWLHTGDVGTLDQDGYLRITDRKKDMYITGGFNCYPAEVEKLLSEHPKVEIVAVIGIPDDRLGEVGKAFIVLRPNQVASAAEVIAWARDNMANYKVPRVVEFCVELPKNASGKVLRRELRTRSAH
ncbi:MAG: FadD3 family acyl-CoA ligase [Pseudomonadota bacterium]|jgi:acyl-CoA synthetase (AMP-forming)/AMP-acid ligase II